MHYLKLFKCIYLTKKLIYLLKFEICRAENHFEL